MPSASSNSTPTIKLSTIWPLNFRKPLIRAATSSAGKRRVIPGELGGSLATDFSHPGSGLLRMYSFGTQYSCLPSVILASSENGPHPLAATRVAARRYRLTVSMNISRAVDSCRRRSGRWTWPSKRPDLALPCELPLRWRQLRLHSLGGAFVKLVFEHLGGSPVDGTTDGCCRGCSMEAVARPADGPPIACVLVADKLLPLVGRASECEPVRITKVQGSVWRSVVAVKMLLLVLIILNGRKPA